MWQLYDQLIETIPKDVKINHIHVGPTWTIVYAGPYCGFAATVNERGRSLPVFDGLIGVDMQSAAELCKSWDFLKASAGTAVVNAYCNHPAAALSVPGMEKTQNAFFDYAGAVKNKKAAIIGHFFNLERFLTNAASISVLERKPSGDDYPDSACEFILPQQDFIFITGSAFINKTLPRLLQLSAHGRAVVLGPSTPMSPVLFQYGADELSGLLPNYLPVKQAAEIGRGYVKMGDFGQRVRLRKEMHSTKSL